MLICSSPVKSRERWAHDVFDTFATYSLGLLLHVKSHSSCESSLGLFGAKKKGCSNPITAV